MRLPEMRKPLAESFVKHARAERGLLCRTDEIEN
jgi:hypothetical protein